MKTNDNEIVRSGDGTGASNKNLYRGIDISFRGIDLKLFGRSILQNVYGDVKTKEILVVMGPSGAGKTSLMNALAGRRPPDKGDVYADGKKMSRNQRRMVGYVEQNDVFCATLTLEETLKFTALLRMPSTMTYKAKMERVEQVIEILELQKCRATLVGSPLIRGLSGGEKKRTAIACELLPNPALLLMDEPTTGLDSTTAYNLMYSIKQFCVKYNKSVIINIHQPSSQIFYMSDKLLLLIEGKVGYFGPSHEVLDHFHRLGLECQAHYNPADFIMDCARGDDDTVQKILAGAVEPELVHTENVTEKMDMGIDNPAFVNDSAEDLEEKTPTSRKKFDENDEFILEDIDVFYNPDLKYQSSYFMQLYVLTLRQLKIYFREVTKPLNLIAMILVLIIVCALFFDTKLVEEDMRGRLGLLYFVNIYVMFSSAFNAVLLTISTFPVVFKERMSSAYRLSALCIACTIGDLLLGCVAQLLLGMIVYWTTGFRSVATFFLFVLCLLLFSASMTALATALHTALNDVPSALLATILSCLFGFLVSGYIINPLPEWCRFFKYIVPLGYAYNCLAFAEFGRDFMIQCANGTSVVEDCNSGLITEFESSKYLYNFDWAIPVWGNVIMLAAIPLTLRIINYIMLRYWRTPLNMIMQKPSIFTFRNIKEKLTGSKSKPAGPYGLSPRDHENGQKQEKLNGVDVEGPGQDQISLDEDWNDEMPSTDL